MGGTILVVRYVLAARSALVGAVLLFALGSLFDCGNVQAPRPRVPSGVTP